MLLWGQKERREREIHTFCRGKENWKEKNLQTAALQVPVSHPLLKVYKCHSAGVTFKQNLLTVTQLNSHLLSTYPIIGNFSSRSLGGHLCYPDSFYPSHLVYSTDLCSPSTCQLGSSLYSQETCYEPIRCQTSLVVSSPCQTSCYRPRTSSLCSPCWTTYAGCLGFKSSSFSSLSSGSRRCYSLGCGFRGLNPRSYGVCGFPSLGCGSRFFSPTNFASSSCQSPCYRPTCGFCLYRSTC
eukprot:bmy_17185T0